MVDVDSIADHIQQHHPRIRFARSEARLVKHVHKADGVMKTSDILEEVEEVTRTQLKNAVDHGLLEENSPDGGRFFFIHSRLDRSFFGGPPAKDSEKFEEIQKDIARLLRDAKESKEILEILADEFDTASKHRALVQKIERKIENSHVDCAHTCGQAIEKIKRSDEISRSRNYDSIGWRSRANRYNTNGVVEKLQ
jgi:hypothetical protein